MNYLYKIIFEDGSGYNGGTDYFDTKWLQIPDKKIKTIFYRKPFGKSLVLSGYDKYFHVIEATQDLNGKNKGKVNVEFAYIMGKKEGFVNVYKINVKTGNVKLLEYQENDIFIQSLNKNNWR